MWSYSGEASCRYGVSGIVSIQCARVFLDGGVEFTVRVDALPLTDEQRHDLEWGFAPANLQEIVTFAAHEFCHRAPWSRA